MGMPLRKPRCGPQHPGDASFHFTLEALLAIVGGLAAAGGAIYGAIDYISTSSGLVGPFFPPAHVTTILGITAPTAVWIAAGSGAAVVVGIVGLFYYKRCLEDPDGVRACSAGVVQTTVSSFREPSDFLFPFTAMHNRIDVVVKSSYWPLVSEGAGEVKCNSDPDQSPILQAFFHTDAVCAAGLGATIGAVAGGAGGIVVGAIVGALIGCSVFFFCLLAILFAFLIAAALALAGAFAGGNIARIISETGERHPGPKDAEGHAITARDYVKLEGPLSVIDGGAIAYWFVDESQSHKPGRSLGVPPFSYTEPDFFLFM